MKSNDTFDKEDEELLEPGSERFDDHLSATQHQVDGSVNAMKDIMRYAAGQSKIKGAAGVGAISYSELSDAFPQDSMSENVAELADNGFLQVHFYTLDELASDDESPVMMPETTNKSTEEALSYIEDSVDYENDKITLPGISDALVSIGPVGRHYIEDKELEYAGEQAVKANKRSGPIGSEPVE